jgi:hypothetical protein
MKRPQLEKQDLLTVKQVIRDAFFGFKFQSVKFVPTKRRVLEAERQWFDNLQTVFDREISRRHDTKTKLLLSELYENLLVDIDQVKEEAEVQADMVSGVCASVELERDVYEEVTDLHTFNQWARKFLNETYEVPEDVYNNTGSIFFAESAR